MRGDNKLFLPNKNPLLAKGYRHITKLSSALSVQSAKRFRSNPKVCFDPKCPESKLESSKDNTFDKILLKICSKYSQTMTSSEENVDKSNFTTLQS